MKKILLRSFCIILLGLLVLGLILSLPAPSVPSPDVRILSGSMSPSGQYECTLVISNRSSYEILYEDLGGCLKYDGGSNATWVSTAYTGMTVTGWPRLSPHRERVEKIIVKSPSSPFSVEVEFDVLTWQCRVLSTLTSVPLEASYILRSNLRRSLWLSKSQRAQTAWSDACDPFVPAAAKPTDEHDRTHPHPQR